MTKIGKYELIRELGKGATSTVYLAHDPFADRQVAIKLLNLEGMGDEEGEQFKKLFLTEASLAGKLVHPYIAAIYDAVITDDVSYLVMEYVGGGTLERYCQVDNLLPADKVIEIVFKCCHALGYACQHGIIHRDIKPENILIVEGTDIKISDFGAAIVKKDDANEMHPVAGSLAYMSPQQVQEMKLTQQADIYSLGVMFYKMLTGSLPFTATDDASLAFQILHVDPPLPSTYRMDLPKLIDSIVMRSLAKNLEDRYQNWEEFEQELTSASEKLPKEVSSFPDTEKFNTLRKLDFFREFGENELWEVLHLSNWAYYPEGTTIIREGDETASFFIILSGEAEIRKNGRGIASVNEGECVGEMSGIRKEVRRRSASVMAHSDIRLIEIYDQSLARASEVCQRYFDKAFLELLANRLAEARTQDKSKEKANAKLSDASPTGKPEVISHIKPSSGITLREDNPKLLSMAAQEGCPCLELRRTRRSMFALSGLVAFSVLLSLFLLLK
jgi:serine/threonine protein kinase